MLTSKNKAHLSQPEGTPFAITPVKDMLGFDNVTPFGNTLLTGTTNTTNLPLSKLQKLYFSNFQKASCTLDSPFFLTFQWNA